MKTGRAAKAKGETGFTTRTVMAMVAEMVEARARINRACVQFETLAREHGVRVDWDQTEA
jgi:hypothetical protein